MQKALTLFDTTIGKKAIMAVTGLVLFGFVIGHMLGNLQVFLGPEQLNAYAEKLRNLGPALWAVRLLLLFALVLHLTTMFSLWGKTLAARGEAYRVRRYTATSYAALSMWLTGPLILLFVIYHIAHFTYPGIAMGGYEHLGHTQVYANVINGFSVPWVAAVYVAAQLALGLHLYHGAWSLFQSLGIAGPRVDERRKTISRWVAAAVVVGNISIPVAVQLGAIR